MNSTCKHRTSAGFTLVEMLVVFVIIAILIGILVPVIASAYRNAKQAAEVVEINSLVTAMQQVKDRYGAYPPSQLVLIENGDYSPSNWNSILACPSNNGEVGETPAYDAVFVRSISVQYLRKYWPQIPISETGPANLDNNATPGQYPSDYVDWNGDFVTGLSAAAQPHVFFLTADECLVFFFGGIPTGQYVVGGGTANRPYGVGYNPKTYPPGVLGFSKNPSFPMVQPVAGTSGAGRDGPFYEFDSGRLIDRDSDGFWEFWPLRKGDASAGYAYFSAYDGVGYRPDDMNLATELNGVSSNPNPPTTNQYFRVNWPVLPTYPANYIGSETGASLIFQTSVHSPGPNPYTTGPPFLPGDYSVTPPNIPPVRYIKPDAFQIISPGLDGAYGQGGAIPRLQQNYTAPPFSYVEVKEDDDNLGSFTSGNLKDAGK